MLIFDEAQNLSVETLEELRMFSNINADKDELIQLVLVGQPELRDLISRPELVQFSQRVAAEYHLPGMSSDQVQAYIVHRLAVAGAEHEIFTPAACEMVQQASRGVPRLVNQICDYALVYAFTDGLDGGRYRPWSDRWWPTGACTAISRWPSEMASGTICRGAGRAAGPL